MIKNRISKEEFVYEVEPVKLECPCGLPLQVAKVQGKWLIGHFDVACSKIAHCTTNNQSDEDALGKSLYALIRSIKDGTFIAPEEL